MLAAVIAGLFQLSVTVRHAMGFSHEKLVSIVPPQIVRAEAGEQTHKLRAVGALNLGQQGLHLRVDSLDRPATAIRNLRVGQPLAHQIAQRGLSRG